jgi:hypothetical protein
MRLFDWLKPKAEAHTVTQSALAQISEGGNAVVLDQGQTCVKLAEVKYPEAKRITDSLREFPDDWAWRHKGYELEHVPTGFCMWVANKDYGLAELTSHGGKHEFNKAEQLTIWPAVEAWLARGKVGFTGRLPKVRIHHANGVWWCLAKEHPWAGAGISPVDAYRSWARAVSIQERKDKTPNEPLQVWSRAL